MSNGKDSIILKRPSASTSTRHVKVNDNVNVAVVVAVVALVLVLVVVDGFSKKATAGKLLVFFSTMENEWDIPDYSPTVLASLILKLVGSLNPTAA
jgi:hypothetical protein